MTFRLVAAVAALSLGLCATARAELASPSPSAKPAPRVIASTGSYVADAQPLPAPQTAKVGSTADSAGPTAAAAPRPAAAEKAPAVAAKPVAPERSARIRTAKYSGGEGSTWKTGRDAYGFMGSFGGCRYSGHAGPNGYTLDRVCR